MKRKLAVLLLIVGLVGLEYGCKKDPIPPDGGCDDAMSIIGVSSNRLFRLVDMDIESLESGEEVAYDRLMIRTFLAADYVFEVPMFDFGTTARGIVAYSPPVCWTPKTIKIYMQAGSSSRRTEITDKCSLTVGQGGDKVKLGNSKDVRKEIQERLSSTHNVYFDFYVDEDPQCDSECHFIIKFINADGSEFETITDLVNLKP